MKHTLVKLRNLGLLAMVAAAIAGCGGGGGSDGASGTNGTTTTTVVNVNTGTGIQQTALTAEQWQTLQPSGTIVGATFSKPKIEFTLTDGSGNPILGLESNYSKAATTDVLVTQKNVFATVAKLMPGTNNGPSRWVNYLVTNIAVATGVETAARTANNDSNGTLTYNATKGTYTYEFARDIANAQAVIDAGTYTGNAVKADLDDLTFDTTKLHRIVLQISGPKRGTGTNTADGVQVTPAVNMENPLNLVFDFNLVADAANPGHYTAVAATSTREIVKSSTCQECHSDLFKTAGPHAGRIDPRYCVTCHTNQRGYNTAQGVLADGATTYNVEPRRLPAGQSGNPSGLAGASSALRNFPIMIHAIHMGERLPVKTTAISYIDEVKFPQPVTNCVKCHDGSATAANKTSQGDNWKTLPNRQSCGACHNNINWISGYGHTANGAPGAKANDADCATCHTAAKILTYHVTVDPTGATDRGGYPLNTAANVPTPGLASGMGPAIPLASQLNMPEGVYKIGLELSSATLATCPTPIVAGNLCATVKFRVMKDGSPVTLAAAGRYVSTYEPTGQLIQYVDGTPSIYVAYGIPMENQSVVVEWNQAAKNQTLVQIRNAATTAISAAAKLSVPDANGWYTVVLDGTSMQMPSTAKLVTAAFGINYAGFTQLNAPGYTAGIRLREPEFAMLTATGNSNLARRKVVENARCLKCHGQLGVEPSFHSGARNNGGGCAMCHQPDTATGHTGAANGYGGGWSVQVKNLIHGIHGKEKRTQNFTYEATVANPLGFGTMTYPGRLSNCEQCHIPGSYDFSTVGTATTATGLNNGYAKDFLNWTTDSKTAMPTPPAGATVLGLSPWVATQGAGFFDYSTDNLVSSPIAAACFGCHDSSTAIAHMETNNGTLVRKASTVTNSGIGTAAGRASGFKKVETCMVCHDTGKTADIKVVHKVP
ncbi:MAG: OmcA/MtrC family decaheme c-type cytochrome [Rhodocyclales bacterium]|nr:OmcA/MtrC family decaheme c-type cytochrome [Rhodocyclales bacterium]